MMSGLVYVSLFAVCLTLWLQNGDEIEAEMLDLLLNGSNVDPWLFYTAFASEEELVNFPASATARVLHLVHRLCDSIPETAKRLQQLHLAQLASQDEDYIAQRLPALIHLICRHISTSLSQWPQRVQTLQRFRELLPANPLERSVPVTAIPSPVPPTQAALQVDVETDSDADDSESDMLSQSVNLDDGSVQPSADGASETTPTPGAVSVQHHSATPRFPDSIPFDLERLGKGFFRPMGFFFDENLIFDSVEHLRDYLANDPLHCNRCVKREPVNPKTGLGVLRITCGHKTPAFFQNLHAKKDKQRGCCPWEARGSYVPGGKAALYLPRFGSSLLDIAMDRASAVIQPDEKTAVREDAVFHAEGHIHTKDGSGMSRVPLIVKNAVRQTLKNTPELRLNSAIKNLKSVLPQQGSLVDKALTSVRRELKDSGDPVTFSEKWDIIQRDLEGKCKLDAVPDVPDHVMVVTGTCRDEEFDERLFALIGTRESFELSMKVSTLHTDTTFNVTDSAKETLFGMVVQDAAHRIFPIGYMVGEKENKLHYEMMFVLLKKAWSLLAAEDNRVHETGGPKRLPEPRIKRVVFDGFKGAADVVRTVFGDECARTSCNYHMLQALERFMVEHAVNRKFRQVMKRCVYQMGRAPSAFAVLVLWDWLKLVMQEIFPGHPDLAKVFDYMDKVYLNIDSEFFGWFAAFVPQKFGKFRPVASRSNNPIESHWHVLKTELAKLHNNSLPRSETKLIVFLCSLFPKFTYADFKDEVDVLADRGKESMKLKVDALIKARQIQKSNREAGVDLPGSNTRFFFLSHAGVLLPLGVEEMKGISGEFIEERGNHCQLDREAFTVRLAGLDRNKLLVLHNNGWIIQFGPDHLPGTEDSFEFATCTCGECCRRCICTHLLAIHFIFRRDPNGRPGEATLWPLDAPEYKQNDVDISAGFTPCEPSPSDLHTGQDPDEPVVPVTNVDVGPTAIPKTSPFLEKVNQMMHHVRGAGLECAANVSVKVPKKPRFAQDQQSSLEFFKRMSQREKNDLAKQNADSDFRLVIHQLCHAVGLQAPSTHTTIPLTVLTEGINLLDLGLTV